MNNQRSDIESIEDIKILVDVFYEKVRSDDMLSPIFEDRINGKWQDHLEKMYRFWETVLLGMHSYVGSPFIPHANLPINERHFQRWIFLFNQTLDQNFKGKYADKARWQGEKMAEMFKAKLDHIRNSGLKPVM
ncbi:MAG: group III truncated hemoglobin [Algicola sp.]|nr:group III truncated hemoglobin [Algicola sp.]